MPAFYDLSTPLEGNKRCDTEEEVRALLDEKKVVLQ